MAPNPRDLLFDDLVHLPSLRDQHAVLAQILEAATGPGGVVSARDLLAEALETGAGRSEAIESSCRYERDVWGVERAALDEVCRGLESLAPDALAEALITGASPDGREWLRWPLPNFLFARDLGAVVGEAIALTYAAKPARLRGMALARVIFRHHPDFAGVPLLDVRAENPGDTGLCLEGGDVQVVDGATVLVGASERTTSAAIEGLATMLFDRGYERVLTLEMPKWHGAMHLDTLFTRIDHGHVLLYPPMVNDPTELGLAVTSITPGGQAHLGPHLVNVLNDLGFQVEPVFCGGDDPTSQRREQWSDGANAFALAPGIFVTYRRNQATLEALEQAGFPPVSAEAFLADPAAVLESGRRAAIHLDGHELVRGRGGPRCLTLPLVRA